MPIPRMENANPALRDVPPAMMPQHAQLALKNLSYKKVLAYQHAQKATLEMD